MCRGSANMSNPAPLRPSSSCARPLLMCARPQSSCAHLPQCARRPSSCARTRSTPTARLFSACTASAEQVPPHSAVNAPEWHARAAQRPVLLRPRRRRDHRGLRRLHPRHLWHVRRSGKHAQPYAVDCVEHPRRAPRAQLCADAACVQRISAHCGIARARAGLV